MAIITSKLSASAGATNLQLVGNVKLRRSATGRVRGLSATGSYFSNDSGLATDMQPGKLTLTGGSTALEIITGDVVVGGGISGSGTLQAVGATTLGGALHVSGAVVLSGPATGSTAGPGSFLAVNAAGLVVLDEPASTGGGGGIFTTIDSSNAYTTSSVNIGSSGTPSHPLSVIGISELSGGVVHKRVYKTGNYTVTTADYLVGVNSSGGAVTLTLPAAGATLDGQTWLIKDEGGVAQTKNITITGSNNTNTIEGTTQIVLASNYAAVKIYCDGNNKFFVY